MSAAPQLRLVPAISPAQLELARQDPTRRVFDHWLTMFGKSPMRCKMGPSRRKVIDAMLFLYGEDSLMLAIEGAASDPWCAGENDFRREFTDVEWLLATESRIERFMELGEQLRLRLERADRRAAEAAVAPPVVPEDPAARQAHIERLKQAAARISGRRLG